MMRYLLILLIALVLACTTSAAHAQHGRPAVPIDPNQRGPNPWVKRLIDAINEGTGVEKWKEKDAMRMRVEIDFEPPKANSEASDEGREGEEAADGASAKGASVHGLITYDLRERMMRLDLDGGTTFLAGSDEIAVWPRDPEARAMTRDDVPDEALGMVRDLYHLVALPLWINDEDGIYIPGGLRTMMDEPYYAAARIFREPESKAEDAADGKGNEADTKSDRDGDEPPQVRRYPDDWYMFFSDTYRPHRIDAAAILMHDRSRPLKEFPMPRIVFFDDFEEVGGVAIARTWRLHEFSRVHGPGEKIGSGKVSFVEFVEREEAKFEAAENALRLR